MAKQMFQNQKQFDEFQDELNRIKRGYERHDLTPVEAFEALTINLRYGATKAAELVETWRKSGGASCHWIQMSKEDLLRGEDFVPATERMA